MFNKKEYMKEYRLKNKEKIRKQRREHYQANKEILKEKTKQWYQKNKEKRREYQKQYIEKNKEYYRKYKKQYYMNNKEYWKQYHLENKEKRNERTRQWNLENKEKKKKLQKQWVLKHYRYYRECCNDWRNNKNRTDIKFNLNNRMRSAMSYSLKGNKAGRKWENLVGYTINDLTKHLNKTIPEGYTWQDYMKGELHIDHIIPISVFNFDHYNQIDFQRCWALDNLQLLPAKENIVKSNKLFKPFQLASKLLCKKIDY